MSKQTIAPKDFIRTTRIIHLALTSGLIIFTAISIFMRLNEESMQANNTVNIYFIIVGATGLFAIFLSDYLIHKQVRAAKNEVTLSEKLNKYLKAKIVKYALLEAPTLISLVFYILTGKPGFVVIAICILLMLMAHYPNYDKTVTDLDLSVEEQEELKNN